MSVLVVGLSHHSAPVSVLERAAVSVDDVPKVLDELQRSESISEVMVLSTCNRIEVYAEVDRFHPAVADISSVLARRSGIGVPELGEHLYVHFAEGATEHLFQVASGLDSMVVGESQILGQLRTAYASGTEAGTVNRVLHDVTQNALRVGKKVHTETGIDRAGASVVSVALDEAERRMGGSLAGRRIAVVGAGAMGALAGSTIRRRYSADELSMVIVNRSVERARRLAQTVVADVASIDELTDVIADVDVLLTSTGATGLVVDRTDVRPRAGRRLVILDLALPRDVDPVVAESDDVEYLDLEALRASGAMVSDDEVAEAGTIVATELGLFLQAQQALAVAPTVTALRARAAQVVDAELERLDGKLPGLPSDIRAEVAVAVRRAVDKVLHAPTVRVKELASTPEGSAYADALRTLFDLHPALPSSVVAVKRSDVAAGDQDEVSARVSEILAAGVVEPRPRGQELP